MRPEAIYSIVATIMLAAFFYWLTYKIEEIELGNEVERNKNNLRVHNVYAQAGAKWYPHEMATGLVRWYDVAHDAVDI